jgi:hypothetical protein
VFCNGHVYIGVVHGITDMSAGAALRQDEDPCEYDVKDGNGGDNRPVLLEGCGHVRSYDDAYFFPSPLSAFAFFGSSFRAASNASLALSFMSAFW